MQFTYLLAVLHNKSHNGSDKYCTSKNDCIDQNSLKSMCFDLAWPDLSSAQGVVWRSRPARARDLFQGSATPDYAGRYRFHYKRPLQCGRLY